MVTSTGCVVTKIGNSSGALWWALRFETDATHAISSVGVDLAGLDSHISVIDVNPAALKRTNRLRQGGACDYQNRKLQRGDGRRFEKVQIVSCSHSYRC